ncbi:hypothetical protein AGABI2DRAFT_190473 [Agaricus bisporus var. bisporus H97]|uniref:hypothetical protein n=1 Tax=Agaricus bisporus var. bisporus (strain H97 / ATCC MYA-4626 / FGSC 10389) TaxID=936046 RepID=UPI00029F7866|nr:hypothetical protein AGABI2DRAFT_190473 [Agaricus bisporus var. bisporus H97]EKV50067.1 hypothetical protein AGABI2DRAFT_190473 [Agaricus bisporus var. bisporus H97]
MKRAEYYICAETEGMKGPRQSPVLVEVVTPKQGGDKTKAAALRFGGCQVSARKRRSVIWSLQEYKHWAPAHF